jgi:predicted nucleotidyltransferase
MGGCSPPEPCLFFEDAFGIALSLSEDAAAMNTIENTDPILRDFFQGIVGVRSQILQLILFGSRARDDHRMESDYDILVVVPRKRPELLDAMYEVVLDVLLTHGRLISLKIFSEAEFTRLKDLRTPFMERIAEEGKILG